MVVGAVSAQGGAVESNMHETTGVSARTPGAAAAAGAPGSARPAERFVYASGAQPLEGYTIKRGVGQGGFGEIYYALSDAGKEVALKLIRRNLDVELRGIRQCLNLKHPNLLDLYDIRTDDKGDTWVVMEYMAGQCLEEVVATHPQGLPAAEALAWIRGIGGGVAYLHQRGIVHRDLKPGNIFSEEGLVKVGDYGLSKFVSCSRRSGHTESVGTLHYMAPEVANGRYGKEVDIYALGILLYELLTGRVPFDGESVGEVLMKHLTARPDVSALAEPYRTVVARALEKDPALRYPSVGEMLAALPAGPPPQGVGWLPGDVAPLTPPATADEETFVHAEVIDDEPVLRAVKNKWHQFLTRWDTFSQTKKYVLLVIGIVVLVYHGGLLVPLGVATLALYCVYRVARTMVLALSGPPRKGDSPSFVGRNLGQSPVAVAARVPLAPPEPATHAARHEKAAFAWVLKPPRQRLAELLGSLLTGALVALAMCVVMILVSGYRGMTPQPEQCAWLALVGIAGTWTVLLAAKFWEGTAGEALLRRFILMVVGLGLGLLACGVAEALWVHLPPAADMPAAGPYGYRLPLSFYADDGRPLAMAYMACFGTLLLVLRWWRQADPLRAVRLSLWSMIVSAVVAFLVAGVWHFPQPWLAMVAATMSVAVQLASPWVPLHQRLGSRGAKR